MFIYSTYYPLIVGLIYNSDNIICFLFLCHHVFQTKEKIFSFLFHFINKMTKCLWKEITDHFYIVYIIIHINRKSIIISLHNSILVLTNFPFTILFIKNSLFDNWWKGFIMLIYIYKIIIVIEYTYSLALQNCYTNYMGNIFLSHRSS